MLDGNPHLFKKISTDTVKKCFIKAGFPCSETSDEESEPDVGSKIFEDLAECCRRCNLDCDVEDVVSFDDDIPTEEGIMEAVDLIHGNDNESDDEECDNEE